MKPIGDISIGDWVLSRSGRWHQVASIQNKKLINFTCGYWACGPVGSEYEVDSKYLGAPPLNKCKYCLRIGRS